MKHTLFNRLEELEGRISFKKGRVEDCRRKFYILATEALRWLKEVEDGTCKWCIDSSLDILQMKVSEMKSLREHIGELERDVSDLSDEYKETKRLLDQYHDEDPVRFYDEVDIIEEIFKNRMIHGYKI